jgi:GR25 family glycosyltransferase involved in LPS biosynthesis
MENIDCIYYINLEHRTDRKEEFLNEMNRIGVAESKIVRIDAKHTGGFGILGCALSHMKALTIFLESNHKNCIIFEDDFTFTLDVNFAQFILNKIFEEKVAFDIVMLAGNSIHEEITNHAFLRKVIDAQTTSGYLITRDFAPKLLNVLSESAYLLHDWYVKTGEKKHEYCLDIYWKKLQPENNWYICFPKLGVQRESYSDIEMKMTNYKV